MARKRSSDDPRTRRKSRQRRPGLGDVITGVFPGGPDEPPPPPPTDFPESPIPLDDEGRRCWRHHAPILAKDPRFDAERDLEILAAFCLCWSRLVIAEKMIEAEGIVVPTADGSVKKHPAVTVATEALVNLKHFANELGLAPASRKRLPEQGRDQAQEGKREAASRMLD